MWILKVVQINHIFIFFNLHINLPLFFALTGKNVFQRIIKNNYI